MNGTIYMIYNLIDDDIYIGCTFKTIEQRLAKHKLRSREALLQNIKLYQKSRVIGWSGMKISELERLPCSRLELRVLEGVYILRMKPELNMMRTGLYFGEDGKYDSKKYCREYYQENIESFKEYYQKNSERILEKRKEKIICECGRVSSRDHLLRHKKSKIHKKLVT